MSTSSNRVTPKNHRTRNVFIWIGVGVVAIFGIIVILSALPLTPVKGGLIENPSALFGIAITALAGIFVAILPPLLRSESTTAETKVVMEAVRENVENDHTKPMRVDMDDKHDEVIGIVEQMRIELMGAIGHAIKLTMDQASDVRGLRTDIGRLTDRQNDGLSRLATVERKQDGALRDIDALRGLEQTEPVKRKDLRRE